MSETNVETHFNQRIKQVYTMKSDERSYCHTPVQICDVNAEQPTDPFV